MNEITKLEDQLQAGFTYYDKLEYVHECMITKGASVSFMRGLCTDDDMYRTLSTKGLPDMTTFPLLGDPTDGHTKIACESLKSAMDDFWKWLKEMVSKIVDTLRGIAGKVGDMISPMEQQIKSNSDKLDRIFVDKDKMKKYTTDLIHLKKHDEMVNMLPNMGAEIVKLRGRVKIKNYKEVKRLLLTGTIVTAGIPMGLFQLGMESLGGKSSTITVLSLMSLMTAAVLTFTKAGMTVTKDGIVDMSKFLDGKEYKPTKMTLAASGWEQNDAIGGSRIMHAVEVIKQAEAAAKEIVADLQAVEKEAAADVKANPDAKNVAAARKAVQAEIQAVTVIQKLINGMATVAVTTCRNLRDVQRAMLACESVKKPIVL